MAKIVIGATKRIANRVETLKAKIVRDLNEFQHKSWLLYLSKFEKVEEIEYEQDALILKEGNKRKSWGVVKKKGTFGYWTESFVDEDTMEIIDIERSVLVEQDGVKYMEHSPLRTYKLEDF